MTTYDKIAAAVIFAVLAIFPVLKLVGVDITADALAAIQVFLGAVSTLGGLIWQVIQHKPAPGTTPGPTPQGQ